MPGVLHSHANWGQLCGRSLRTNLKFMYSHPPIKIERGIKVFTRRDYYWGLIAREQMRKFLELAGVSGYTKAREEFVFETEKRDKFLQYIDNTERADFHFLLPLSADSAVLDLGSGYGNITIPLARFYKKVIAVDTSLELLEFIKMRAESEGLTNIEYVHADPFEFCNLPFHERQFDAVIVSGVMEWVGVAKLDEDPQELQKKFLKHASSFLVDAGVMYLAIENRLFPGYFFRDPHSKLPYTAQIPRWLANLYAKHRGHESYRTYIYSYFSYRRLLIKAGLPFQMFYLPFASYKAPVMIMPSRWSAVLFVLKSAILRNQYTRKWRFLIYMSLLLGVPGLFLSSYMIVASRRSQMRPLSLIQRIAPMHPEVLKSDFVIKVPDTNKDDDCASFLIFHLDDQKPYAMLEIPRDPLRQHVKVHPLYTS